MKLFKCMYANYELLIQYSQMPVKCGIKPAANLINVHRLDSKSG